MPPPSSITMTHPAPKRRVLNVTGHQLWATQPELTPALAMRPSLPFSRSGRHRNRALFHNRGIGKTTALKYRPLAMCCNPARVP